MISLPTNINIIFATGHVPKPDDGRRLFMVDNNGKRITGKRITAADIESLKPRRVA